MSWPAIVLAGGLGTRLRTITGDRYPKPMTPVPVDGRECPFLEFPLAHLRTQGIRDIVICIGHKGEAIRDYFGDGSSYGLRIRYDDGGSILTATRVRRAARLIDTDEYFVVCGDVFHPLDVAAFMRSFHAHPDWLIQLSLNASATGLPLNILVGPDGVVLKYAKDGLGEEGNAIETGSLCLRSSALDFFPLEDASLTPDVYEALITTRSLGSMVVDAPFFDIGTPEGYAHFCSLVAQGGARPLPRL